MQNIRQTISAVITGSLGWATMIVASAPKHITGPEWISGATILATALGVYVISPSKPAQG